jgi:ubiquinone/menaquinone biosynthesis C-methylase UbiE
MSKRPERYRRLESAMQYDRHLARPGILRRFSLGLEMAAFKKAIARVGGQGVLDAPCGTGRLQSVLEDRFPVVGALDSSAAMLSVYRSKCPQAALCCGDIFNLPFRDREWDWVVCYRLFHHFSHDADRVRLLKSVGRVCREGVILTAWLDTPFNRRRGSRRSSISRQTLEKCIAASGLEMRSLDFVAWPFQPKCVVTCGARGIRQTPRK